MPVFEVELDDGTKVDIEADRQPTPEEAQELISKTPRVGKAEAFGIGAARSIAPSAAFAAGASIGGPLGMKGGAALGALVPGAGETGISELVGGLLGAGVGSLALGGGLAAAAEFGQDWLLKKYLPKDTYEKLSAETAAAQAQHPGYSEAGGIAGMLPSFEIAPLKVAQLPFRAALGATVGAVQPLVTGRAPTKSDVLGGAAAMTLFGKPRSAFEGLTSLTQKGLNYATQKRVGKEGVPGERPGDGQVGAPGEASGGGGLQPEAGMGQEAQIPLAKVGDKIPKEVRDENGEADVSPGAQPHIDSALNRLPAGTRVRDRIDRIWEKRKDGSWFMPKLAEGMELDPDLDVDHQSVLAGGTIEYIPQTEAVAQATQVPLSREELASRDKERMTPGERALADIESQKYEEAERAAIDEAEKMGTKATVVETPPEGDENVPWAAGQFMRPTPDGGVEINRPAFRSWVRNTLSRLPLELQPEALRARRDEDQRHGHIISQLGGLGKANT